EACVLQCVRTPRDPTRSSTSRLYLLLSSNPPTTETYTLSLHDALPISAADDLAGAEVARGHLGPRWRRRPVEGHRQQARPHLARSEEHTSELQSLAYLVCRLLLEKKKKFSLLRSP